MLRWIFVAAVVLATAVGSPAMAQTADPHIGTWKLNVAKSKRDPAAGPGSQSQTRKYEVFEGDGTSLIVDSVDAQGKHTAGGYSAHFDGKPYPDRGNNANFDHVAVKKVDAYTWQITQFKAGKVYSTTTNVVSKDGKTMTATSKGTNAAGQAFTNVAVYDKQ